MGSPARSSRCRYSSPPSARRASPMPRRRGAEAAGLDRRACSRLRLFRRRGAQTVSDNLKAGITKASFHEPMVNRTYADMARHYGTAIVPARPYKPRDKAKVEVAVQVVGRWILARLRHRRFFSLAELNAAIRALLDELNDRPMRGWGLSRRALFEQLDQPALERCRPNPMNTPSGSAAGSASTIMSRLPSIITACRIELLRQEVEARITAASVEIFQRGKRVASHRRSLRPHRPTTVAEHMPSSHRRYRDWTHERIRREAGDGRPRHGGAGRCDHALAAASRAGLPLLIGILGLVKRYGDRARRGRLRPRAGPRHPLLQLGRRNPEEPPRARPDHRRPRPRS